jgi:hypothetical protein
LSQEDVFVTHDSDHYRNFRMTKGKKDLSGNRVIYEISNLLIPGGLIAGSLFPADL